MQPLITICARAGSKGLPGKNTKLFNGKPLICWTIERALEWDVGPIVISSDDKKVEDIFGQYMHEDIYFDERPKELAKDDTPKMKVLKYIVSKWWKVSEDRKPPYIVDLDPTNPCRSIKDLEEFRNIFEKNKYKTLVSVTKAKKTIFMNQVCPDWPFVEGFYKYPTRRQDAPLAFDVNSNIYFYNTEWLLADKTNYPIDQKTNFHQMPDYSFCDIDTKVDFEVAEFLHRKYYIERT